jgi:sterol desaturase/sphingolipid hydroxylase (fatty acid hydroxylase superfamily)
MLDENLVSLYSTPLIIALIVGEAIYGHYRNRNLYTLGDTATNFYLMGLAIGLNLLMKGLYLLVFGFFFEFRVAEITDPVVYWIALLLAQDFLFYILHYVDHYCRLFWAVHVTHHSSEHYNFSVGFRSSVFQPMYRFIYFIPLAWLGFRPMDIMGMYALTQIWGIFVHTETIGKLHPVIEFLFVTPSHHRVHHASNAIYLDKNMGMFLIIWDRIFGTFQEELQQEPVRFGLTSNPHDRGPVNIVFHEFKAIASDMRKKVPFVQKLKYIFAPPGWSHDNSTKTSRQIREMYYASHQHSTSADATSPVTT